MTPSSQSRSGPPWNQDTRSLIITLKNTRPGLSHQRQPGTDSTCLVMTNAHSLSETHLMMMLMSLLSSQLQVIQTTENTSSRLVKEDTLEYPIGSALPKEKLTTCMPTTEKVEVVTTWPCLLRLKTQRIHQLRKQFTIPTISGNKNSSPSKLLTMKLLMMELQPMALTLLTMELQLMAQTLLTMELQLMVLTLDQEEEE